jgi:hypothetical protein
VLLGATRPTIANINRTLAPFFLLFFVPMGTIVWGNFDFSFFILYLWVQLDKGTLLPTIANNGGALVLLYLFCLLLELMVILFLSFITNEIVENDP